MDEDKRRWVRRIQLAERLRRVFDRAIAIWRICAGTSNASANIIGRSRFKMSFESCWDDTAFRTTRNTFGIDAIFRPFRAACYLLVSAQGFALGCHIAPLQGFLQRKHECAANSIIVFGRAGFLNQGGAAATGGELVLRRLAASPHRFKNPCHPRS
jgi:hypothetical protein